MNKFTLSAAALFTVAICATAVVFHFYYESFTDRSFYFYLTIAVVVLFFVIFNYYLMDFLLKFYSKKQIQQIKTLLPEEYSVDGNDEVNFVKFGEKVYEINQRNAIEIDTMKAMEGYRKEYIGNVSHELKTPLFSIQGYVETLMDGGVENLTIRDKYLERIDKSVERLLSIVKDLDMISQFESGEIQLQYSIFDIHELAVEVSEILDLEAQKKGAQIVIETVTNPVMVKADKQKIAQVLTNLISNAIYYANRDNALITIRIGYLKNKVVIQIIDNGMGIKPEALPRIFERFYRVESSRSRREGGSGLGLAIVKHIMEAHQQKILVESTYLENTIFTFFLERK